MNILQGEGLAYYFMGTWCGYVLACAHDSLPPPLPPSRFVLSLLFFVGRRCLVLARVIASPKAAEGLRGHAAGVRHGLGREQARRAPRLASRRGATR